MLCFSKSGNRCQHNNRQKNEIDYFSHDCISAICGCQVVRDEKVEYTGDYLVTNSDCVIRVTSPLAYKTDLFEIDYFKKDKASHMSVDWMQASYQYENNPVHRLNIFRNDDLKRFGTAAYIPTNDALVIKLEGVSRVARQLMRDGHYKTFVEYVLSGSAQTNTCSFDFHVKTKKTVQWEPYFYAPGG